MRYCVPVITAIFALLSAPAFAQVAGHEGTAEQQQACQNDAFDFCQAEMPDDQKVYLCLKKNRSKLTKACRNVIAHAKPPAHSRKSGPMKPPRD
jgi:hypothetical protein